MEKILVVDDENGIRKMFIRIIKKMGYQIFSAENGSLALEILRRQKIDLVITDYFMPEMDGLELIITAKQSYPGLPFVMITGCLNENLIARARAAGVEGIMQKPFDFEEFEAKIQSILKGKKQASV